tara:strand:+ start:87 stop:581 length:495 start_codon:yes stop_codon:yes gene_type:complete
MIDAVATKASISALELAMLSLLDQGELVDAETSCVLTHRFAPKSEEYGCYTYARELSIPAGSLIVGKIHKHAHISFLLSGKIVVVSESGREVMEAPRTFVSEAGVKRAGYVLEDCVITNVHLTEYGSEDDLNKIEEEVIAKTYSEIGMAEPNAVLVSQLTEDLT